MIAKLEKTQSTTSTNVAKQESHTQLEHTKTLNEHQRATTPRHKYILLADSVIVKTYSLASTEAS